MARLVATADGNFTTAATWAVGDATADLDSEAASTALTTGNTDSSTFVLAAVEVDAVLVKLASRTAGSPTNTITIHLRNSTSGTNVLSLTVNVSDLQTCDTTNHEGGWYMFKFGSTHTPNGADSYLIRATLNSTSTAVSLWTSTGTNLSRIVRTTTTAAPAAGDRMVICKEMTAAGAATTRSVTMDNTASTTFGSATGISTLANVWTNAALQVGNGGTLTWGTTAATNYLLKLTGSLVVSAGGTYVMGSSGTPIPRDSTAIIEWVMTTSGDSRLGFCNLSTWSIEGLSRTSGKNVIWCLLNTDEAAGQTTLGVDTDTGWKSGDEIGIASTTQTASQSETRILSGDANAADMTVTVALTNAHGGSVSDGIQAEVVLLTRNIQIRSDNVARFSGTIWQPTASGTARWAWFKHQGFSGVTPIQTTTGSLTIEYCSFTDISTTAPLSCQAGSTNNYFLRHITFHSAAGGGFISNGTGAVTSWEVSDIVSVRCNSTTIALSNLAGTFNTCRVAGTAGQGYSLSDSQQAIPTTSCYALTSHSNSNLGVGITGAFRNGTWSTFNLWRNGSSGLSISSSGAPIPHFNAIINSVTAFGNNTSNVLTSSAAGELTFRNMVLAGDTTFATATGLNFSTSSNQQALIRVENSTFGVASGTKTTHATRDILIGGALSSIMRMTVVDCTMASSTEISVGSLAQGSWYAVQKPDGALAGTKKVYTGMGTVAYETATVHSPDTVSEKLTPSVAGGATLCSSPVRLRVINAQASTITVWVRKDSSYNGAFEPRLVVRANPAVGVDVDTVLDTLSVAADTWEQLSASIPTPNGHGMMEFAVEVDGTAGNAFVGLWEVS